MVGLAQQRMGTEVRTGSRPASPACLCLPSLSREPGQHREGFLVLPAVAGPSPLLFCPCCSGHRPWALTSHWALSPCGRVSQVHTSSQPVPDRSWEDGDLAIPVCRGTLLSSRVILNSPRASEPLGDPRMTKSQGAAQRGDCSWPGIEPPAGLV